MNSNSKTREYPLLYPGGKMMKPEEFLATKYDCVSIEEDPEDIIHLQERICLNEGCNTTAKEMASYDPELFVRTILEDLLKTLRAKNPRHLSYYEALSLSYDLEVKNIFYRTRQMVHLNIKKLKTLEKTTCFLVNLTNLLWIHAQLCLTEDLSRGLLYRNWGLRHIHYSMIGYTVGSLGFVSLYDLHSTLLNYPVALQTRTLNSLKFLEDARLHSLLCQPYIFSPKVTVLEPTNLIEQMTNLQDEYLRSYVIVDQEIDLLVPVPLLMQLERMSYVQKTENEKPRTEDGIPPKLDILVKVLKERGFPYFDLLSKDVYMINLTEFKILFEYSVLDLECRRTIPKTIWKCCRFHKSLYHCLDHHVALVRSTLLDEHLTLKSACGCTNKDSICINNVLCKMSDLYRPMLNDFKIPLDFENNGSRCLYAAVSFAVGIKKKKFRLHVSLDGKYEFLHMLKIVQSVYLNISTPLICRKISICVKIFFIVNNVYEKWPTWYTIFVGNPNEVLDFIVENENATLAIEWVKSQQAIEPGYTFELEAFSKFILLLSSLENDEILDNGLNCVNDLSVSQIYDFLLKRHFILSRQLYLIPYLISSTFLNESEKLKCYSTFLGLKLIDLISVSDQIQFIDLVTSPLLIVEQLMINKKITLLKIILNEYNQVLATFPEHVQNSSTIARPEIDEMLREYATKALHFCRKPSQRDCLNAALLHAEIFKEDNFYPPSEIPPKHMWIPNNWVPHCMCCKTTVFSVFVRRHHCRRCGRVVCGTCSSKKMKVAIYLGTVRVCDRCYEFESQNDVQDDTASENSSMTEEVSRTLTWKLSTDENMNTLVRRKAVFESAPDIELCLSILELHTESIVVPRVLYSNAGNFIRILRQRLVNPANYNYKEVAHITRSLLIAAKIYFTHLNEPSGAKRCEDMCSEIDILNHLSKIKSFPNDVTKPISNIEELKRIRDTVLEKQQWELALEISTKIGVECASIWYLWGMALLKSGNWSDARDKFSKSSLKKNSAMLNDILQYLYTSSEKDATARTFANIFRLSTRTTTLPENVISECLYYLNSYGTPKQYFDFYVTADHLLDALKIVNRKKISVKLFIDNIFVPYLSNKGLFYVLEAMKSIDYSLYSWKDYVEEMCVYCNKNKEFTTLYQIQIWMEDWYRAAISCTKFYVLNVNTYSQLNKNNEYLVSAVGYLNNYLKNKENKLVKKLDKDTIDKYLIIIQIQMEVCRVICTNSSVANTKFSIIPTMFGDDKEKSMVMILIFESQTNFKSAFDLVEKLIRKYCSNTSAMYKVLAEDFMKKKLEKNLFQLIKLLQETKRDYSKQIDEIAVVAIKAKAKELNLLINSITDINTKIEMYIECDYVKSAYTMAVRYDKLEYIEPIKNKAESINMTQLKEICVKKLASMKASEDQHKLMENASSN